MTVYEIHSLSTPGTFGYISWDVFGIERFIRSVHFFTFLFSHPWVFTDLITSERFAEND